MCLFYLKESQRVRNREQVRGPHMGSGSNSSAFFTLCLSPTYNQFLRLLSMLVNNFFICDFLALPKHSISNTVLKCSIFLIGPRRLHLLKLKHFTNIYLCIKRVRATCEFTPQTQSRGRNGPVWIWKPRTPSGFPHGQQGPKYLNRYLLLTAES